MIALDRPCRNGLLQTSTVPDTFRLQFIPALQTGLGCFSLQKEIRE